MKTKRIIFITALIDIIFYAVTLAQFSAGHAIGIRVIRPNIFRVKQVINSFQANTKKNNDILELNWRTDLKPKIITVSHQNDTQGSELYLQLTGDKVRTSKRSMHVDAFDQDLPVDISNTTGSLAIQFSSASSPLKEQKTKVYEVCFTVTEN
jgi:hypothetical protein